MYKTDVRGRVLVPVQVTTTILYDMGPVQNVHEMSEKEVKLEAEEMVMEYLDKKLTPSRRIAPPETTSRFVKLTAGRPYLGRGL